MSACVRESACICVCTIVYIYMKKVKEIASESMRHRIRAARQKRKTDRCVGKVLCVCACICVRASE